jgi:hypothetical protein
VEIAPKRRIQRLPAAEGGATIRLPAKSCPRGISDAYRVSASLTPASR